MLTEPDPQPRTSGPRRRLLTVCLPCHARRFEDVRMEAVVYSCDRATTYLLIEPEHGAESRFGDVCRDLIGGEYDEVVIFGEVMCHSVNEILENAARREVSLKNLTVLDSEADRLLKSRGYPR